jgi:hypothetical protein
MEICTTGTMPESPDPSGGISMRVMARVVISTQAGNRALSSGALGDIIQSTAERWKPEAMYFTAFEGKRCAYMIFDMPDSSDIPPFAEPLFNGLDADIDIAPVMDIEELQQGLAKLR